MKIWVKSYEKIFPGQVIEAIDLKDFMWVENEGGTAYYVRWI